jgi:hypothetical protein
MRDRNINLDDLNQLRIWLATKPNVPAGPRYRDFGGFKLCGEGKYPKPFFAQARLLGATSFNN